MILSLLLILTAPARAEDLALSYDEAIQRGLERNPTLLASGEDLRAADGALLAAKGTFDPNLSANTGLSSATSERTMEFCLVESSYKALNGAASLSQYLPTGTSWSLGWDTTRSSFNYALPDSNVEIASEEPQFSTQLSASLSQPLLEGWRMSYNMAAVRSARQARASADLGVQLQRQQTIADVAAAYWALYAANRQLTVAQQSEAVAREEQRVVHANVEAGKLAPVERSRVDAAVVQAQQSVLSARTSARGAEGALLLLLGEDPAGHVTLITAPAEPTATSIDEDAAVQVALERSPTLLALRLSEEQAEETLRDARHARLPELSANASYALQGYETSMSEAMAEMFSGDLNEWALGASLSVPLGNRVDRGNLTSADASAASARLEREATERAVAQQVRAAAQAVGDAAANVELARANLRLAEETLSAERALQEVGRAIQKDVLQAIRDVDTARLSLESAHADWLMALVELERLKGTL